MSAFAVNVLAACLAAVASWLGFFKSEHPDVGVARYGGNPADRKHELIARTVRRAAFVLLAAATALGFVGLLLADGSDRPTFTPLVAGGAVVVFVVAVASLHEVVMTFAVARAARHWMPGARDSVRPYLERLESMVRLGGVAPEREHEIGSWTAAELARVRVMDAEGALAVVAFAERLLELEHAGELADRVQRLRREVGTGEAKS